MSPDFRLVAKLEIPSLTARAETAKAFVGLSGNLLSAQHRRRAFSCLFARLSQSALALLLLRCLSRTRARSTAGPKCPNIPSPGEAQARADERRSSASGARPHAINTTTATLAKLASSSHPPSSRPPAPPHIDKQVPSVVVHRPSTSIADRPTAAAPSISSSSGSSHSAGSSALRGLFNRLSGTQQNKEEQTAVDSTTVVHDVSVFLFFGSVSLPLASPR